MFVCFALYIAPHLPHACLQFQLDWQLCIAINIVSLEKP